MPTSQCPPRFNRRVVILEASFACDVCGEDKPVRLARRIGHVGSGRRPLDVCRDCFYQGVEDGIVDPDTRDFVAF